MGVDLHAYVCRRTPGHGLETVAELFFARHREGFERLVKASAARGFPSDVPLELASDYAHHDDFGAGWLSLAEVEDVLNRGPWFDLESVAALLRSMDARGLEAVFVFWFDC